MTDKMREQFNETIVDPARKAIHDAGTKLHQTSSDVGLKMLDQAETNAREAFAAMRAAAAAKDLSEVMKIQGDFLRDQGSRSIGQAREIGELIASFGRDTMGLRKD